MIISFLGTGLMGAPMVRRLLASGFAVRVWNRSPEKAEVLVGDGAEACATAADAVTEADFIILMMRDGPTVSEVVVGSDVAARLRPGSTLIDMSSTTPAEARALAEHLSAQGIDVLDAPVSGGTAGAAAGTLAIMAGGPEDAFARALPVLRAMGRPVRVGPSGTGQLAKLANQAIVAVSIGAVAEALLLTQRGGADPAALRAALAGGFADSTILQQHGRRMSERDYAPGGRVILQLKDLNNVLDEARAYGLRLPLVEDVRDRFAHLCHDMGHAESDHAALMLELEARNTLPPSP